MRSDDRNPTVPRQLTPRELAVLDALDELSDEMVERLATLLRLSIEQDRRTAAAKLSRGAIH